MIDYIFLMHGDAGRVDNNRSTHDWNAYIATLREKGVFGGGSAIGDGACIRKSGAAPAISRHLSGFIRVRAESLDHAKALLDGNPVFEAGGTVEIRELPRE